MLAAHHRIDDATRDRLVNGRLRTVWLEHAVERAERATAAVELLLRSHSEVSEGGAPAPAPVAPLHVVTLHPFFAAISDE